MLFTHHACQVSSLEGLVARPVADVGQGEGGTTCVDPQSRKVLLQREKMLTQGGKTQGACDFL